MLTLPSSLSKPSPREVFGSSFTSGSGGFTSNAVDGVSGRPRLGVVGGRPGVVGPAVLGVVGKARVGAVEVGVGGCWELGVCPAVVVPVELLFPPEGGPLEVVVFVLLEACLPGDSCLLRKTNKNSFTFHLVAII